MHPLVSCRLVGVCLCIGSESAYDIMTNTPFDMRVVIQGDIRLLLLCASSVGSSSVCDCVF